MENKRIAEVFEEMGNILDISGANFFRVNAYRKAALTIMNLPHDLSEIYMKDPRAINAIDGIGKALSEMIVELIETGKCEEHERMKKGFPKGLLEMLHVRGLGPKKVKLFYSQLAIKTIAELKKACEKHLVQTLDRMGAKSEEEILKAIEEYETFSTDRSYIHDAQMEADAYVEYMRSVDDIVDMQFAGSLRRRRDTIGDIDILTTVKNPDESRAKVIGHFVSYPEVLKVIAEGDTKSSVILKSGIQVDLRVIDKEVFGAALHYFTGSKEHNIRVRDLAKRKGLKVSEYGVFRNDKLVCGKTEEEVFNAVGLPYIIPEIRSNRGEIEYGLKHKRLPDFIELADIKGDLHSHSTYSDGENSIEEMAHAMRARGYEYFAITDHSAMMGITGGMDRANIEKQWKEIDKLNKKLDIKILKGCEVDIKKDGTLDFEDGVLKKLDVVIIAAHMNNRLDRDAQTKRLISAIENPYSMILAHPTGRIINKRSPMEFDMAKVIDACVVNNVALEINCNPTRLDLVDKYVKMAKDMGAKFVINTDSHSIDHTYFMNYGIGVARRGWLASSDVLNTMSFADLTANFKPV